MKRLLALVSVLALTAASSAYAEVVANTNVPFAAAVNGCNGDNVNLTGDAHIQARITVDGNGGVHAGVHVNADAKGTGSPSGANYKGQAVVNGNINSNSGGAAEGTLVVNIGLIAQGKAPNFKAKVTLHITVNANGTVTATVVNVSAGCK